MNRDIACQFDISHIILEILNRKYFPLLFHYLQKLKTPIKFSYIYIIVDAHLISSPRCRIRLF